MHKPATREAAAPPLTWSRAFPGHPDQVREARAFLRAALDGCPAADDAVLCISELAANAVLHSDSRKPGGTFTVRAEVPSGDYLWIEVEDCGGTWNGHAHCDGRPHGLDIVRALATESGIDGDPVTGWVAWARFDVPLAASHPSHGSTAAAREAASGATTMTSAGQALTGLRDALAVLGITTTGLILTRHNGKLHPEHGPAIGYHAGLYWWPARRLHASRLIYAIHDASDPAGAARRIARTTSRSPSGAMTMPDIMSARLTACLPARPATDAAEIAAAPSPRQPGKLTTDDHHCGSGVIASGQFQRLQALEDAIAYRRARVTALCPDCMPGRLKCDDHACDLNLIAAYQQTAIAAILDMSSQVPRPSG